MSSSTPQHLVPQHEDPEAPLELSSLKRQLQFRSMERESAELFFLRERAVTEGAQRHLEDSLTQAQDALSSRKRQTQDAERQLLRDTAQRNRQLQYKEERVAQTEMKNADLRKSITPAHGEVALLQTKCADARQQLSDLQSRADQCLQRIRSEEERVTELKRSIAAAHASRSIETDQQRLIRESLENQVHELEAQHAVAVESAKQLATLTAESESAHQTKMNNMRKQLTDLQESFESQRLALAGTRRSITTLQDDEEEAARRRRKAEEDSQREFLTERKAESSRAAAAREELLRTLRASLDKDAAQLNASIESLGNTLLPLREECSSLFDLELRLSEECGRLRDEVLGVEALRDRRSACETTLKELRSTQSTLQQHAEALQLQAQSVADERTMLAEIVAPGEDIDRSLQTLRERIFSERQTLADLEAQRVIQRVAMEGGLQAKEAENNALRSAIASYDGTKAQSQLDIAEKRRSLEGDLRILFAELDAVNIKVSEILNRNKLLDSAIEHSARQKKLLQEDLENRRELARRAAATLLAQLEE